jgi:hypothetical protein
MPQSAASEFVQLAPSSVVVPRMKPLKRSELAHRVPPFCMSPWT